MEQIVGDQEAERKIRSRIETEYGISVLHDEMKQDAFFSQILKTVQDQYCPQAAEKRTIFAVMNDKPQSMLCTAACPAAMRRNPAFSDRNREPCMTDILRVDTSLITMAYTEKAHRNEGHMKRLVSGALAYQEQLMIPLCTVETKTGEFFSRFGFHYIYDRPQYELNTDIISEEMLSKAVNGETVPLNLPGVTLKAADSDSLLSLAHFVNANLCRRYGLFIIRSASYYEHFYQEIRQAGGNLFLLMENGRLKGYFAYVKTDEMPVREAVFEKESDRAQYLLEKADRIPAVMARIVNLPEMLKHISGSGKITIAIRLTDPVLAENDGIFIWYIDEKGSHMERVIKTQNSEASSTRPEVSTSIGEFTAFIFEYIKLKHNAKFDNIYLAGSAWLAG